MSNPTVELCCELIRRSSVTPEDAGCQQLMAERLAACGFEIEYMPFEEVSNLWARRGSEGPLLVFAGHTDVVPPGPLEQWTSNPFEPETREGLLYGRGAADMKGSLAAMVTAVECFVEQHPGHRGSIGFLITSDEEGPSVNGTVKVIEALQARGEQIDYCLVGEPSSSVRLGDTVKHGRRGSITGLLSVKGVQGHVAYPQLADNPVHRLAPLLAELCAIEWDQGDAHFPPTSLQVTQVSTPAGAENVIPGQVDIQFNLRYSPAQSADSIRNRIAALCEAHGLEHELRWRHSGAPFITQTGELLEAVSAAIEAVTGTGPELSTAGGTSDGRFIAPTGAQVVELGPVNASIHKIDEHVAVEDLSRLSEIYEQLLGNLLL